MFYCGKRTWRGGGAFPQELNLLLILSPEDTHVSIFWFCLFYVPPSSSAFFPFPTSMLQSTYCWSIHWQPCFIHNSNERHLFPFPSESLRVLFKPAVCQLKCQKKQKKQNCSKALRQLQMDFDKITLSLLTDVLCPPLV